MHLEEVREAKRCTGIESYEITTEAWLKHWDNAAWWAWSRLFQGQFLTTSDGRLEPDASASEARAANVKHGPGGRRFRLPRWITDALLGADGKDWTLLL